MKPEQLYALLAEIEKEDPMDFSGLPFDGDDLRKLACLNVAELVQHWEHAPMSEKELIMATTMVRLVLENLVLNARLCLLMQGDE